MAPIDRFAPSPTSPLHLGNLRTALAGWLLTRADAGTWLLRVEDLDRARVMAARGVEGQLIADLRSLGLTWDPPVLRQSQRAAAYREALAQLSGLTYECFCTRREIAEASSAPHDDGFRPYPGTCSRLSTAQAARLRRERPAAIRIRAEGARFTVEDTFAGPVTGVVDDFVLVRGDGQASYNFAVVVDDVACGVTRVTRARDLLASAPRQAWLTTQLGGVPPSYAHLGLVTDASGHRLAKRHGAVTMADLAGRGWDPADVLAELTASLGLGRHRSVADALMWLRRHGPSERFWAGAVWDDTAHSLRAG
ncbi:MAG: tRNA glutamyl-Q(34) synthetase GluQRS [Arachnia sp.]